MAYTLDGNSLGSINKETVTEKCELIVMPMPASSSDSTEVWDFMGVTMEISIGGTYEDTSLANLKSNFIDNIRGIISGSQTGVTFASDLSGSIATCFIDSFEYTYTTEQGIFQLSYTIKLVRGK